MPSCSSRLRWHRLSKERAIPLNRLWLESAETDARDYANAIDRIQADLADVAREIDLWDAAGPYNERLKQMYSSALELMVSGPPEDLILTRERIKVIRSLLDEPLRLEAHRQELERTLDSALAGE